MRRLGRYIKHKLRKAGPSPFDRMHAAQARDAYDCIVAARPENALSSAIRAEIVAYAKLHLGSEVYAPWLETYAAWRGEFVEGWMPDNYCGRYLVPYSSGLHPYLLSNTFSRRLLETDRLPDVGYIVGGRLYDLDGQPVGSATDALFGDHGYLYLKHCGSNGGRGIERTTPDRLADDVSRTEEAVLQTPIDVHPELMQVFPKAPATLRITTVHADGNVRAVAALARFGSGGDTHLKGATHVRVPLDVATGDYKGPAGLADWTPVEAHPDTGFVFSGWSVPHYAEALEMCCELHKRVRVLRFIGWDVAITSSGDPMLFEGNSIHPDIKFSEAATGPIFAGLDWDRLHLSDDIPGRLSY